MQVQHSGRRQVPQQRDGRLQDPEGQHPGAERYRPPHRQATHGGGPVTI